jgi:dTDP-3-amino-3,4,6-trideoxy-alpha-D-glucose transaminase
VTGSAEIVQVAGAVPFVDLSRALAPIEAELAEAVTATVGRGDYILGEAVERFEAAFAAYVGVPHAIGVGSGTAALTIATRATGLRPGDEVIVPGHTYIASALGVLHAGARPVFCEVERSSGLIDLDHAASLVGPATAAVLPVHLYGQCCDLQALSDFADRHGLALIEDAAQAHGARWHGTAAGSVATSAFSFYPSKNLGALGDGGIVCTTDANVAASARQLRNLGQRGKGEHVVAGYNERLDTIQAAALAVKLPHLDGWNDSRRRAASIYRDRLEGVVGMVEERPGAEDVHHLFPIRVGDREALAAGLAEAGIGTGVHYPLPAHRQPPLLNGETPPALPEAEAWAAEELSLPIFAEMTDDEVERVCDALVPLARGPVA